MTGPRREPAADHEIRTAPRSGDRQARLRSMLNEHGGFVARTLRRAGVPQSDVDDEVQRTFIIASDRLEGLQLAAERRFLFNVALNVAAHMRRTFARRRRILGDEALESIDGPATPEQLIQRKRAREMLNGIIDRMPESLREAFMLYAFEELTFTEIATVLAIPRGTVASRIRRARRHFHMRAEMMTWHREGTA